MAIKSGLSERREDSFFLLNDGILNFFDSKLIPDDNTYYLYLCFIKKRKRMLKAEIVTGKGTMKVEFYEKDAPATVKNFTDLAKEGFYDGLKFHRVIPGFVIQGGCPNTRKGATGMPGTGGPGYKIACETGGENQYHDKGVLSMAHAGPNTGGSQFFIVLSRAQTAHLDRKHTCFGKVTEGLDVIDAIRADDVIEKITVAEG
jgi:peptidyl-prolyl cis-trans isomerase B (cyclophilin B)